MLLLLSITLVPIVVNLLASCFQLGLHNIPGPLHLPKELGLVREIPCVPDAPTLIVVRAKFMLARHFTKSCRKVFALA